MMVETGNGGVGEGTAAVIWAVILVVATAGLVLGLWRWREVEVGGQRNMVVPTATSGVKDQGGALPVVRVRMVRSVSIIQTGKWTRWTESGRREFWGGGERGSRVRVIV